VTKEFLALEMARVLFWAVNEALKAFSTRHTQWTITRRVSLMLKCRSLIERDRAIELGYCASVARVS